MLLVNIERINRMVGDECGRIIRPPPRRNQLRSQAAVYQLHLVQDLRFLITLILNPYP